MYEDGYTTIHNIDFSKKAISIVEKRAGDKPGLTCLSSEYYFSELIIIAFLIFINIFYDLLLFIVEAADVLSLVDKEESVYDVVIDKGTLDSILCGDGSFTNVQTMLQGISKFDTIFIMTEIIFLFLCLLLNVL